MATEKDTALLVAELSANYNRLKKDLDKANGIAVKGRAQLENGFRKSNSSISRSADDMSKSVARSYERAASSALQSSNGLKSALLGSAASIGAAFGAVEIANFADGYTRFTNQLKTAGLESANLSDVQERLFSTAQKYGVELEALGTLYGRNASAAKELNLGTAQQLQLTNAVGAALKIQGGSTEAASGALLQLSQVLGGSKVQAEEYNSLIDGLRPLLQGVASASDKYKGSVAALTKDVKAGNVTSREFAELILKASAGLEARATKSNFTIAASFQVVNNALGKYIGETDSSLSVTERISQGLVAFANNLETVIPALVVIVGLIGVRYAAAGAVFVATETARTAALVRTTLATEAAAAANAQLAAAGLRGTLTAASQTAAISSQAVAMGVATTAARGLGGALLSAFGGPVGVAILAITASIAGLIALERQATQATAEYANMAKSGAGALRAYEDAALAAATATGKQATSARDAAAAAREEAIQVRDGAKAKLQSAKASIALLQAEATRVRNTISPYMGEGSAPTSAGELRLNELQTKQAQNNVKAASDAYDAAVRSILNSDAILNARAPALLDPAKVGKVKALTGDAKDKADAAKEGRFASKIDAGRLARLTAGGVTESVDAVTSSAEDIRDLFAKTVDEGIGQGLERRGEVLKATDSYLTGLQQANYDATYNGIRSALDAVKQDGVKGFAQFLADSLSNAALDGLAKVLTDAFTGGGRKLSGIGTALGIPGFATGTNYAPGGLAYVHKNETIQLPKGSRVNTVAQTAAMMQRQPTMRQNFAQTLNFKQTIDLTGANGDATIYAIAHQAAAEGTARALRAANKAAPGRQISYAKLGT